MAELRTLVKKLRSKNAGPFWLTIDIFCGTGAAFDTVVKRLASDQVAKAFAIPVSDLKRFDIPDLKVIKFSLPRPEIQGARADRDLHGASWAMLIGEIDI